MEVEIVENRKQSLFAYKNGELLFYSTIKFNWLKKNLVKIFDSKDNLILELQSYDAPFRPLNLKVLSQNIDKTKNIIQISEYEIVFNENKKLMSQKQDLLSFNQNCFYWYNGIKIAEIKQTMWNSPQKIILHIDEKELKLLDFLIIHILAVRTGYNSD